MKARVILLHNTEEAWENIPFKPELGEIIVYDPDENYNYARIKIGDGEHVAKDLDFCVDAAIAAAIHAINASETIDAGRITQNPN